MSTIGDMKRRCKDGDLRIGAYGFFMLGNVRKAIGILKCIIAKFPHKREDAK